MSVIDEYLKKIDDTQRTQLERVRQIVQRTAPQATEVITYGMPGFKFQGKYLIAFAAFKDHLSVFPGAGAIKAIEPKLSAYKIAKGTVQFTPDKPLSEAIIKELVQFRVDQIEA